MKSYTEHRNRNIFWNKLLIQVSLGLAMIIFNTVSGTACEFFFNYPEITGALGTTGAVAVRVLKDHQNCSMVGLDYQLEGEKVQILEETEWKEVGNNLFEKRLLLVLSETGQGYLQISKDCTNEGYDEQRLPVTINAGEEAWKTAFNYGYPYDVDFPVESIRGGSFSLTSEGILTDNGLIGLPEIPEQLRGHNEPLVVYYTKTGDENRALLVVGQTVFYRFY